MSRAAVAASGVRRFAAAPGVAPNGSCRDASSGAGRIGRGVLATGTDGESAEVP